MSPAGAPSHDRPLFGILCMNSAVALFVAMDAVIKTVSGAIPTGEIVFFRNLFAFVPILVFMARRGLQGRSGLIPRRETLAARIRHKAAVPHFRD